MTSPTRTPTDVNPWEQLLAVQMLDTTIQKLDHRSAQLPERVRLVEIDDRLAVIRADVSVAEAEKHALVREQRRIEDEVAMVEERIAHEESQLYGGGSSDAGLLQSLQDEIAGLRKRIAGLEDEELELMVQIEPIDERLASLALDQRLLDDEAMSATTTLAEAESSIDADRQVALTARIQAVADIDPDALARYETTRDRLGGIAVARLDAGVCGSCHMKLSAVEIDRIQHLPADAEVRCEDCDRFLVSV